jgi:primosomal protein N' (replication factor Y)
VLVQTRSPEHHALVAAARHDVEGFLAEELRLRQEPAYPPFVALANVVVSGETEAQVADAAVALGEWLAALLATQGLPVELLGPAPCAIGRIKDRWRWHLLLRGRSEELGRVVRYAAERMPEHAGTRVVIDRDPVSLL